MGMTEKDPRKIAYIALLVAITWYKLIDSEQALRIARGRSSAKPGKKLTPELREQIMKLTENPNFRTFNGIEKKFKINRFDIITSEEAFAVGQVEMLIKRLKEQAEGCSGICEKCVLNAAVSSDLTMCEFLCDVEIDKNGKPQISQNKPMYQKYTNCILKGETSTKSFKIYKIASERFDKFMASRKGEKVQDIVSAALVEYAERHK